ncbi:unnamed protein product [Arctia plantaginis]|uniref:C2H2-type domain-containing protein n=1 Tax=Arctia plantaginis TaxID=874455 RepID=A0A8S1A050_ARCPL|nr:unnamed protein product [Arctia plantaginis]
MSKIFKFAVVRINTYEMAGNKMNPKAKGREDKNKTNPKTIGQTNEDVEEPDFALLRKPIPTSITGFGQVRKIFDMATAELKDLLSKECDLLYECKVCRNLFRSLANFISHKRVYCKEKFNTNIHSQFVKSNSMVSEIMKIKRLEQGYQESLKESSKSENKDENDVDDRIPLSKDLTTIIEKIANSKGSYENSCDEPQIALQKIPNSTVAMFQNIETSKEMHMDDMRVQVKELDNILSRDTAVMQSDGNFKIKSSGAIEPDNVIQISDDEDNDGTNILKCKICDMQFSTQKTLKFHMKYKHVETRLVYPCPDCLEIFSTSWSVYRHLFKVHRKTAAQIRRLRESIQAKAFKMNNPPAFYEKRKNNMKAPIAQKITEEERIDQENQAWMDNMEGDGELPRCGGCGRTFERRAALAAHTHTCQPRSRALSRRPQETKKIEIQIRKDYNKGPPVNLNIPLKTTENNENKPPKDDSLSTNKPNKEEQKEPIEEDKEIEDAPMDVSEDDKSNDATESPEKEIRPHIEAPKLTVRLPFAHQTEKSNQVTFRQKILPDIELGKLSCKRCDIQFNEIQELYDHMAEHLKWMRYACKLCNFKSYSFEKLPEHVKVVHKLKGDKDFYFSTVKALDGTEALDLCEPLEEMGDANETSPDSGRPSRCSSDSSRLSDDSSSSSTRIEGSRKRKIYHNKSATKRRKDLATKGEDSKDGDVSLDKNVSTVESYTSSSLKSFEENSSDMDDVVENITKKQSIDASVASRRPVRRRTKPKNEDFEYDLSNLLKMEAQGYRDALVMQANAKSNQSKKKVQQDIQINYENLNKDCCGALMALSKKSVERATAHIRTSSSSFYSLKEIRPQNIFLRPMLPRTLSKGDKVSPKKDINEDRKECSSPIKEPTINKVFVNVPVKNNDAPVNNDVSKNNTSPESSDSSNSTDIPKPTAPETNTESNPTKEQNNSKPVIEIKKPISIPPIKFRRQSLDVIKNPLINKNISDFTKAGMKTKILVIKPINRNKDGTQAVKTPLKFQTIKLKDPNKNSSNEDKVSDQVVVVKVPKVECTIARPAISEVSNSEKPPSIDIPTVVVPSDKENTDTAVESNGTKTIEPAQSEPSDEQKSSDGIEFIDENVLEESSKNIEGAANNDNVVSSNSAETIQSDNVNKSA